MAIEFDSQFAKAHTNIGSIHKDCNNLINFSDVYCNLVQYSQHIHDWSDYNNCILKSKENQCMWFI